MKRRYAVAGPNGWRTLHYPPACSVSASVCSPDNGHAYKDHIGGPFYRCRTCGQLYKDAGTGTVPVPERALADWQATR